MKKINLDDLLMDLDRRDVKYPDFWEEFLKFIKSEDHDNYERKYELDEKNHCPDHRRVKHH